MTTRANVSNVPLQGGYVAKQCPVRAQNDLLRPVEPRPFSPVMERRFKHGLEFESEIVSELSRLHPSITSIEGDDSEARESSTKSAMAGGSRLILNGRLPADETGRRVGKPDLLVAASGGGYRAVDIKHHLTLEAIKDEQRGTGASCSDLTNPELESASGDLSMQARKARNDLLQLAHYQRMLEAAGLAAADGRFGGIIGKERRIVWRDLDAKIFSTPSSTGKRKRRSSMEVYDFEFDFRLDIIAAAQRHLEDSSAPTIVVPVRSGECPECPWWDYCRPQLEAGSGDVSLLRNVGWREWKIHHDRGIKDRAALAALEAGSDLYSDVAMASLPEQIDAARASLGPHGAYRRRGIEKIVVPRGGIEIDVDMENVEEGVYLWGALVTDRAGILETSGCRQFVTWEPLTERSQTDNFISFWTWFADLRQRARDAGVAFRAYCYSAGAENRYLSSLGRKTESWNEIKAFMESEEWVDLLKVFQTHLITGLSLGLKAVAALPPFEWEVDDPGGAESMVKYDLAVGSTSELERNLAREWLLSYNADDVRATLKLRDWLQDEAGSLESIESLNPRC